MSAPNPPATVTDTGVALIEEVGAIVMAKGRRMLERLTDDQLGQLRDILVAMETSPEG